MAAVIGVCLATTGQAAEAESKYAAHDVSAATDPHSSFWKDAPAVFVANDTYGKPVPNHKMEVRSRWTKNNLYLLFICPYETLHLKPNPTTKEETNKLWDWDVAESFIGSDFDHIKQYKEFEVSPRGEWVDLDIDLEHPKSEGGWKWNSGMQAAGRIDAKAKVWYGFMRIPYASIDSRPAAAGNTLRINFYRCQGPTEGRKYMAWGQTNGPSFHVAESFGTIKLVD